MGAVYGVLVLALWQDFIALTRPHARAPNSPAGQVATGGMAFEDALN